MIFVDCVLSNKTGGLRPGSACLNDEVVIVISGASSFDNEKLLTLRCLDKPMPSLKVKDEI